ncbi:hypothetical protein JRO89_XS04G0056300 [Xanthoceras sorbifolium]|uniref:PDZ domain-containing protein n=1 Tax=Xanthoceras sorbifolium TaxID=99658 RepID=A0ABQ8I495_9ROSI|nr:hypothetical protein JRO89_XS04G0056300 [Xanthoceras sorbifolium]
MSSAVVAGASSSCSATFSRNHSIKVLTPNPLPPSFSQKTTFQGLSLQEAKRGISDIFKAEKKSSSFSYVTRGLEITARTAGASKTIEVDVDKPLGLTLGQKSGGGVVITAVENGGNAARAGLKAGDQVLYTSSFFGDELWPADKLGFTKTAIQAKPDSVYFVVSRFSSSLCFFILNLHLFHMLTFNYIGCRGAVVDVKRLPKRPAPPRFGRKLTEAQKASILSASIGLLEPLTYALTPETYACPQCKAPKKRFAAYDVSTGKPIGGGLPPIGVIIGLVAGVAGVGALLVYGLQ